MPDLYVACNLHVRLFIDALSYADLLVIIRKNVFDVYVNFIAMFNLSRWPIQLNYNYDLFLLTLWQTHKQSVWCFLQSNCQKEQRRPLLCMHACQFNIHQCALCLHIYTRKYFIIVFISTLMDSQSKWLRLSSLHNQTYVRRVQQVNSNALGWSTAKKNTLWQ